MRSTDISFLEFGILPHPAKTNNPSDLNSEPATQGGLQSASANAYNARGPHVPTEDVAEGLEKPKSRDEVSVPVVVSTDGLTLIVEGRGDEVE